MLRINNNNIITVYNSTCKLLQYRLFNCNVSNAASLLSHSKYTSSSCVSHCTKRYFSLEPHKSHSDDHNDIHNVLLNDKEKQRSNKLDITYAVQHGIQHAEPQNQGQQLDDDNIFDNTYKLSKEYRHNPNDITACKISNHQPLTQNDIDNDVSNKQKELENTSNDILADRQRAVDMIKRMQYWKKDAHEITTEYTPPGDKKNTKQSIYMKVVKAIQKLLSYTVWLITHPQELPNVLSKLWKSIKHELHHYWLGSKLFYADVKTALRLVRKTTQGKQLTRRESRQLRRTFTDTLRIIPFSVFIIVPFMELALPVFLKLFPNMLPTSFRTEHKENEDMKRELRLRLNMAEFLQSSVEQLAKEKLNSTKNTDIKNSAEKLLTLIDNVRHGKRVSNNELIDAAKFFNDEVTLDNLSRSQLISMCRYIGVTPVGTDEMLRFLLENRLKKIKEDDKLIDSEGIDTLSLTELKQACRERGMRSDGLTRHGYIRNLLSWIDLSLDKQVPATLLILSRSFSIRERPPSTDELKNALQSINNEILDEIMRDTGLSNIESKLNSLRKQNELIESEETDRIKRLEQLKLERQKDVLDRIYRLRPDLKLIDSNNNQQKQQDKQQQQQQVQDSSKQDKSEESVSVIATQPTQQQETTDKTTATTEESTSDSDKELARQVAAELASLTNPYTALQRERKRLEELKNKAKRMSEERKQAELSLNDNNNDLNNEKKDELKKIINNAIETDEQINAVQMKVDQLVKSTDIIKKQELQDQQQQEQDDKLLQQQDRQHEQEQEQEQELEQEDSTELQDDSSDKSSERLQQQISSMINKLEKQLQEADVKIGSKLHILDRDNDQYVSEDELSDAIQMLFNKIENQQQAHRVARIIADMCNKNESTTLTVKQLQELADRLENSNGNQDNNDNNNQPDKQQNNNNNNNKKKDKRIEQRQ